MRWILVSGCDHSDDIFLALSQCRTMSGATSDNATMSSLWSQPDTRIHLIVYWIFSFVMSCIDESFPLFCISKEAGLGLSEASIGKIMSGSGVIFAVCQYFVYTSVVDRYGLYGSIKVGSVLLVPLVLLIPLSREFNTGSNKGEATWATLFLSECFIFYGANVCTGLLF